MSMKRSTNYKSDTLEKLIKSISDKPETLQRWMNVDLHEFIATKN